METLFTYHSPLGRLTIAGEGEAVTGLWLPEQKYFAATLGPCGEDADLPVFQAARRWLDRYFAGEDPGPPPLLAPKGGPFRQAVWALLREIPRGQVTTYGALARTRAGRMGRPSLSAQAVGGAVGHNPISILIPCHRVVGAGGNLTGYAGGLPAKVYLLHLEGADTETFFTPKRGTAL